MFAIQILQASNLLQFWPNFVSHSEYVKKFSHTQRKYEKKLSNVQITKKTKTEHTKIKLEYPKPLS
jgi:hypothetical protein